MFRYRRRCVGTLLVALLGSYVGSAEAQDLNLQVSCDLINIHDYPPDEVTADVRFRWTSNAAYVLIEGRDVDPTSEPSGSFVVHNGAGHLFVAVRGDRTVSKFQRCQHSWRQGTGINGLMHSLSYDPHLPDVFSEAYERKFSTSRTLDEIRDVLVAYLQRLGYTVRTIPSRDTARVGISNTTLVLETSQYNVNENLCWPDECEEQAVDRSRRYQIAYGVWVESVGDEYRLLLKPNVLVNLRRQDNNWKTEPDGPQIARDVCEEILAGLITQLHAPE